MDHTYTLPYGKSSLDLKIDRKTLPTIILPNELKPSEEGICLVKSAIRNPLDGNSISEFVTKKTKVAITINDKTRPVPNNILFPPLLGELERIGIGKENITILIATGTHPPMVEDEFPLLLNPKILTEYAVISHNSDDLTNLVYKGKTDFGTEVYVNKIFDKADIKIVVGDIEPHHFAGFSGGSKSASIGLCGRTTINQNHTLLLDERSRVGSFENNPVRQDIEQIGELIEVNYALNAVLNYKKEIIEVFFGKPSVVITKGVELSKKISMTQIDHPFDLVIASAGGYPKDINFYQSQKALTHASLFCKNGGTVLLFAECEEGVGNEDYVRFMQGIKSHTEAIEKFTREGFSVGPHKAYQTAKIAGRIKFQLVSSIQPSVLDTLLIQPVKNLDLEVHQSIVQLAKNSTIAIIPFATNTIPYFKEEK